MGRERDRKVRNEKEKKKKDEVKIQAKVVGAFLPGKTSDD